MRELTNYPVELNLMRREVTADLPEALQRLASPKKSDPE